jgi:pimeloyl-ACP methyl ester carboxylesterase
MLARSWTNEALEGGCVRVDIRGANLNYEVLGDTGPWVALMPGGRNGLISSLPVGERIAGAGYRVVVHDRRNCGASDVVIEGHEAEWDIWADDLAELLACLGARPAFVGGSSSGAIVFSATRTPPSRRGERPAPLAPRGRSILR